MENTMHKIAFFGLGNMGLGMASNLVKAGNEVHVYDLLDSQIAKAVANGAIAASSAEAAVEHADIVLSMLPAGEHVKKLYHAVLGKAKANTLFIDCSTIDASDARYLHSMLNTKCHQFVDAPVSGGVTGASNGTLTFIIGGKKAVVDRAISVLQGMGSNCFHAGDAGAGQVAKICNNMLLAILMTGTCEALKLAIDNGLDPKVMSEIMKQSSGNNWALEKYNPVPNIMDNVPSSNAYQGGFIVDLMNKDLHLAMSAAAATQSVVPMGALAKSMYQLHKLRGNGAKDFSSIYEAYLDQSK
ncbi:MAG: 3-hydroxyisobutyrate dehydrogenase [Patiriisocius sp.]|jgi:3-hydroxyisobutyrate dehydrogenase